MKKNQTKGEYLAPQVRVKELTVRQNILDLSSGLDAIDRYSLEWDEESSAKDMWSDGNTEDWTFSDDNQW